MRSIAAMYRPSACTISIADAPSDLDGRGLALLNGLSEADIRAVEQPDLGRVC